MQTSFRPLLLAGLAALAVSAAQAQSAGTPAPSAQPSTPSSPTTSAPTTGAKPRVRPDQAIERIRVEDAGSRIDELRVGGETRNITVQPKAAVPAYQIRPEDASGATGATADDGRSGKGSTSWNVLKF